MIALIDYDAGNTCSVTNALDRIGVDYLLTDDPEKIKSSDKVIFPGVGHAKAAMTSLKRKGLDIVIRNLNQPVLGICVGMQLLAMKSEEGDCQGLGIIDTVVKRFDAANGFKVPHMGWNEVTTSSDPLFSNLDQTEYFYFVHSYFMPQVQESIATCMYNQEFTAAVQKDNFWGIQFHAEKSSSAGAMVLQNFINKI